MMEIPDQKREHSCKCTELSLKQKEELEEKKSEHTERCFLIYTDILLKRPPSGPEKSDRNSETQI